MDSLPYVFDVGATQTRWGRAGGEPSCMPTAVARRTAAHHSYELEQALVDVRVGRAALDGGADDSKPWSVLEGAEAVANRQALVALLSAGGDEGMLEGAGVVMAAGIDEDEMRKQQAEVLFEALEAGHACFIAPEALALRHHGGSSTGLVLQLGEGTCVAQPVIAGHAVAGVARHGETSGLEVLRFLQIQLETKKGGKRVPLDDCRSILHKWGRVVANFGEEKKVSAFKHRSYELPNDAGYVTVGKETYRAPEMLFSPGAAAIDSPGIGKLIVDAVMRCDSSCREELFANIVVAGGLAQLEGLPERLATEVAKGAPTHGGVNVARVAGDDASLAVWRGGSAVGQEADFRDMCVTAEEYGEYGASIIRTRCI